MDINLKGIALKITLLLIVFFQFSFGQNSTDSLRMVWSNVKNSDNQRFEAINDYYKRNTFTEPDSVLMLTDFHLKLATEKNNKTEIAKVLNEIAIVSYVKGDNEKAMNFLLEGLKVLKQTNDTLAIARQNANIGSVFREKNNFSEAIKYYETSLGIFKLKKEKDAEADILNNLGLVYYDINDYEFALKYLNQALVLYKKLNLQEKIGNIWLNIGSVYFEQEKFDASLNFIEKALKILEANQNLFSASDCYYMLAKIYQKQNQNEKAFDLAYKGLDLSLKIGNESKIISNEILIADLTFQNNVNLATTLAEKILKKIDNQTGKELKVSLYSLLYKCYKAKGDYKSSLFMQEQYLINRDSIQIEKNKLAIIREAIKKEYESKIQQNKIDFENRQAELKINQLKKIYGILLVSLILIFAIIFYAKSVINANHKKRDELLLELEQLKQKVIENGNLVTQDFQLNKDKIEQVIQRKLNETDWLVLNLLLENPVISNKEIAVKAFMSVDGIASSLRRMYEYFNTKESKYKKISLIMDAIKYSNSVS